MIKKLFTAITLLFVTNLVMAQSILNNGFENWTTVGYSTPKNYFTSNLQHNGSSVNPINVIQSTDAYHGNYAVQLTTMLSGNDTAAAYMANGDPSHPVGQGIPYNQKPTGMRLYYKCNVMPGDTAIVLLMFKAGGNVINQNIQKITGTQSTYALLTFSVNLITTPDSLIFGVLSSNILGNSKGIPGSMLQVDSASFTGVASQPTMLNGDFEQWQIFSTSTLQNWSVQTSNNNNVVPSVQTTDAFSGTYALELQTLGTNQAGDTAYASMASTGYTTNSGMAGGLPYTQTHDSLIFYYKYAPVNPNDSGEVALQFKTAGVNFQVLSKLVHASATYKRVAVPINLLQTPDSVIVTILSSKNWNVPPSYLGADLKIDNIYFKSQPPLPGAALNFDGVDDYVNVPNNAALNFGTNDFTIEADFQASVSQPDFAGVVVKSTTNGDGLGGYQLVVVNGNIAAEFTDGNGNFLGTGDGLQGFSNLTDGNWHHLAMVVSRANNNIKLLVDGNTEASVTNSIVSITNVSNPVEDMLIGVERSHSLYSNANIDEVRIWNRALCGQEIFNNMAGEIPKNANGLVAYYKFNQGVGNNNNNNVASLADSTSNAFNGTLNNFSLTGTTSNFVTPGAVISGSMAPAFITTVATQTNLACNGGATGTASVSVNGANAAPFVYTWSAGGSNTGVATGLTAGNYTCTINYACGTIAKTFTLTEPAQALVAAATSGTIACNGGAATVTVSATGGTPTYSNTGTFTVTANSYTYTVTDAHACSATTTITVTQPAVLTATATANPILCNGGATTVTVSAIGGTMPYSGPGTFTATANSYTYTVTDAHSCSTSTVVTISQPNPVNASVTVSGHILTANNASATYQWVDCNNGNAPIAGATNQTFTATVNGNYAVEVTQASCTATSTCTTISNIGIAQYNTTSNLQVYPNPFSNQLTIVSNAKTKAILFDMLGNQISSFDLQNATQTISVGDIAPGVYYLQVDANKIKIIKQ